MKSKKTISKTLKNLHPIKHESSVFNLLNLPPIKHGSSGFYLNSLIDKINK